LPFLDADASLTYEGYCQHGVFATLAWDETLKVPDGGLTQLSSPSRSMTTLEEAERAHVLRARPGSNWLIGGTSGAAAKLGMKRGSLQYKIKKLGIARPAQCQSSGIESVVWRSFVGNAFPHQAQLPLLLHQKSSSAQYLSSLVDPLAAGNDLCHV